MERIYHLCKDLMIMFFSFIFWGAITRLLGHSLSVIHASSPVNTHPEFPRVYL